MIDIVLNPVDLKIETFRAPGWKDITNGNYAVRITHKPSGVVVVSENKKGYELNKEEAFKLLKEKIMRPDHPMLQHFKFDHLPDKLQITSQPFYELAKKMDRSLPDGDQKDKFFQKLLEAKDCAVRAQLPK